MKQLIINNFQKNNVANKLKQRYLLPTKSGFKRTQKQGKLFVDVVRNK